jgi:fumarate reductase flavoprotein subunit
VRKPIWLHRYVRSAPTIVDARRQHINIEFSLGSTNAYFSVVIIGGGLAGMSAAVEAADHIIAHATAHPTPANSGLLTGSISAADSGLPSIIILESEPVMGGNSAKASSGQSAVGTPAQLAYEASHAADGIRADSPALFIADTLKSCTSAADTVGVRSSALADASAEPWRRYLPADPASVTGFTPDSAPASMRALVDTLAADSAAAIAFLEQHGVVAMDRLTVLGGHSAARTHRPGPGPNGTALTC